MILFNCSCGLRHTWLYPCEGTLDINSASILINATHDEAYAKDVKEEREHGWYDPIKRTRIEP